jgi:ADP-ribosylglycohydrolase
MKVDAAIPPVGVIERLDRLNGVLLGTALGDALGLPAERLRPERIARRFGRMDRFQMLGATGFVSDDTEQAALVAQSLGRYPADPTACANAFRRSLVGWFWRLPWGVGMATIKACLRSTCGLRPSGVGAAGNGAAMRAAIVGVFFADDSDARLRFGRALAEVTHLDERAVAGALFVSELAAAVCRSSNRTENFRAALNTVAEPQLHAALVRAEVLAGNAAETGHAAKELGTSGYVLHTVAFAAFCFLRYGDHPLPALQEAIAAGGDTDSIAAILGGWLGAIHGERGLPVALLARIHDGPFGPAHLRALGSHLDRVQRGEPGTTPGYSPFAALLRNLLLYPVVLAHGFRRLLP